MIKTYRQITGAVQEPINLREAEVFLKIDENIETSLVSSLITAARKKIENYTNRVLITQTWEMILDKWPDEPLLYIDFPPLQSITHIKYYNTNNILTTWDSTNYYLNQYAEPAFIVPVDVFPATYDRPEAITIRFVCGYQGKDKVPEPICQALRLMVGHFYENRELTIKGTQVSEMPYGIEFLLNDYRIMQFSNNG